MLTSVGLLIVFVAEQLYFLAVEQGLMYNESHEWVKVEGDTATIGISDFAQVRTHYLTSGTQRLPRLRLQALHACL